MTKTFAIGFSVQAFTHVTKRHHKLLRVANSHKLSVHIAILIENFTFDFWFFFQQIFQMVQSNVVEVAIFEYTKQKLRTYF